jgi:hypothetical protein
MGNEEKKNDVNYYFKLFIKIILFVTSIYYIYKYRATIRRYISLINRWLRFSSPLRNINTRFRNFQDRGNRAQREQLIRETELDLPGEENFMDEEQFPPDNLDLPGGAANAAAAIAGESLLRNRLNETEAERLSSLAINRERRIPNWTGPIKERRDAASSLAWTESRSKKLEKEREEDKKLRSMGVGTTIQEMRKYIIDKGFMIPKSVKGISERQNLVDNILNYTLIPASQPMQPRPLAEASSGEPLTPVQVSGQLYDIPPFLPETWMTQPQSSQSPSNQLYLPVDFGKSRKQKRVQKFRR